MPLVASGGQVRELQGGRGADTGVVSATRTTPGSPQKRGAFFAERFRGVDLQIACLGVAQQSMHCSATS